MQARSLPYLEFLPFEVEFPLFASKLYSYLPPCFFVTLGGWTQVFIVPHDYDSELRLGMSFVRLGASEPNSANPSTSVLPQFLAASTDLNSTAAPLSLSFSPVEKGVLEFDKEKCQGLLSKTLLKTPSVPNVQSQNESLEDGGVAVAAETAATPIPGEPMDIMTALQLVLRKSLAYGGLGRGLHESAKVIEKHAAQLCVLAEDCDQPDYVKLVKALCAEHNVSLLTVPSAKTLGEWAGLCKIDSEGKARKVTGCSCVVVKDFGEEHEAYNVVLQHVKSH
ncbi:hypothetical protein RIF29_28556 [Crotalaria pallida]|uniref:40S ribosomal protein S12 n=1 Tax=Crotalaria pallida TaxID=3830 RepID=A0AAN9ECV5_CROPI